MKLTRGHYISGLLIIALIFVLVKSKFIESMTAPTCDNNDGQRDLPQSAREACGKISSEAENIKAATGGVSNIIDSLWGLFSPNNYRAGDNSTSNIMQNIINTNLSSCDIMEIQESCVMSSSDTQRNVLDTSMCSPKFRSNVSNIKQINRRDVEQNCKLNTAISKLLEKKESTQAQALAKVLQETEGLLSGNNKVEMENCNIINKDLSTSNWIGKKNECMQEANLLQENIIRGCNVQNVDQQNISKILQSCVQNTEIDDVKNIDSKTKVENKTLAEQLSKGIDTNMLGSSSLSSSIALSVFLLLLLFMMSSSFEEEKKIVLANMNK